MGLLVFIRVSTQTKSAKPGQAQDADGGHRPTENGGGNSLGQVQLSVEPENTENQPDIWRVLYGHYARLIFRVMGQYLNRFCPALAEVLKTFWSLEFPAAVWSEVREFRP
jgi:hypothetical protein